METAKPKERERILADLDKRAKQWQRWRKEYQALAAEYAKPDPDPGILRFHLDRLQGLAQALPEHQTGLEAQANDINERYKQRALQFGAILQEQCVKRGHSVIGRGPELTVAGHIKVQLDTNKNEARVNGKRVFPLALDRVVREISNEWERLWGRQFDAAVFLRQLRLAYDQAAGAAGGPATARAVYEMMAAEDRSYKQDMFAADLARLEESSKLGSKERSQLVLGPSRDTRQAVYIASQHGEKGGRWVGLIDFKERGGT